MNELMVGKGGIDALNLHIFVLNYSLNLKPKQVNGNASCHFAPQLLTFWQRNETAMWQSYNSQARHKVTRMSMLFMSIGLEERDICRKGADGILSCSCVFFTSFLFFS